MTDATLPPIPAVRNFLILAVCYFLTPLALYIGLVAIGAFTGYLFLTNLMISILSLVGFFVGLIVSLVRKYRIKALMLICSVSLIAIYLWRFGDDSTRRYLYMAEVLLTPNFAKKCIPPDGVLINDDTLRLCGTHDFNLAGWVDLIVKIEGPYPKERLIEDINAGNVSPAADKELERLGMWMFARQYHVTGHHLLSDYYLIRYNMCGNADPYC